MQQYMITTAPNYNPDPVSYQQQMSMINGGDGYMYPQQPIYQQPVYQQPVMQPMYQPQPMYGYPQMNPPQPCMPVVNGQYATVPGQGTFTEACQQLQGYQPQYALKEQMDRYANAGIMPQYNGQQNPLDYMTEASKKVQEIEKQTGCNPFSPYQNSPVYNAVINNNQQSMPQPRMTPYQQYRAQAYGPQYANITNQYVPQGQYPINPQYQYANNYNYGYYNNGVYQNPVQQYLGMPGYKYDPNAMMRMKMRIGFGTFGKEFTDQELDQMINPQVPVQQMTREEIEADREFRLMQTYDYYMHMPPIMTQEQYYLVQLANRDAQIKAQYDNMDPIQFLNEELPRLQLEEWERKNCRPFGNNTNQAYSDDKYVMALVNKMNLDRQKQQETGNVPYQPQQQPVQYGVNVNINDANSLLNNPHYTDPTDSHYKDYKQPITSTGQPPAMPIPLKNGTVEIDTRVMDKLNNDEIHQRIHGLMNTLANALPGVMKEQEIAAQKAGLNQALQDPQKMAEHNKMATEFILHFNKHPEQVEALNKQSKTYELDQMLIQNGGEPNV